MADPYIGEIRIFAGNFAPVGWAFCNGQLMAIAENDALFSLIGTTYGGDGQQTFALPNLQSRIPYHEGNGFAIGQDGGAEIVTLTSSQIPAHNHVPQAGESGSFNFPKDNLWAAWPGGQYSDQINNLQTMSPQALSVAGGSQPHDNMLPYLAVNFIICLFGIYPSQT